MYLVAESLVLAGKQLKRYQEEAGCLFGVYAGGKPYGNPNGASAKQRQGQGQKANTGVLHFVQDDGKLGPALHFVQDDGKLGPALHFVQDVDKHK